MSKDLSITGKLVKLLPVESGTSKAGKEWKKQQFLISNNDGYEGKEQLFCFEVFGEEKVENLTKYNKEGDAVTVSFNVSTNEWKDKYFTSLSAWNIKKAEGVDLPEPFEKISVDLLKEESGDLPF